MNISVNYRGPFLSSYSSGQTQTGTQSATPTPAIMQPQEIALHELAEFYNGMSLDDEVLVVAGRGTAALTYLSTVDLEPKFTHVVMLGGLGYWEKSAHRLAQPAHILELPHQTGADFVDPAAHDKILGILPHESNSAYVHSLDYQTSLRQLHEETLDSLARRNIKVHIANGLNMEQVSRDSLQYSFTTAQAGAMFPAHKIVIATGAAPARALPKELLLGSASTGYKADQILDYNDILSPSLGDKLKDQDVLIYGGGATAAWAAEVARLPGKSAGTMMWVARKGFDDAENAGPRVEAIIKDTRSAQIKGEIDTIQCLDSTPDYQNKKALVTVNKEQSDGSKTRESFLVDYVVNCIGQDANELGGLHHVLSGGLKADLQQLLDINQMTGNPEAMVGFASSDGTLEIIGPAAASFNLSKPDFKERAFPSDSLPRSAKVPITAGGAVSTVAVQTKYMPFSQNMSTREVLITGLNPHVMNATQLAVYFTARYPQAAPEQVNVAVQGFIQARMKTEFGLDKPGLNDFLNHHFGYVSKELERAAKR